MLKYFSISLLIIFMVNNELSASGKVSRQKRCIVIQKQNEGGTDSADGTDYEDYDSKRPQPKHPRPDRLMKVVGGILKKRDVEVFSPELLKKRPQFMDMFRRFIEKTKLGNYIH